jgi:hypothetical protein
VVVSSLLLLIVAIAGAVVVSFRSRFPQDPSKFGPERFLALESAEIAPEASQSKLRVAGRTNLPDGARVDVIVATTESLLNESVPCHGGFFLLETRDARSVTNGTYRVFVAFRLEAQDEALRKAIHYQPRRLEAPGQIVVTSAVDPTKELRPRLRALIQSANVARDRASLAKVARDAEALESELWISTLLPGARRLRLALQLAARSSGNADFERLRRSLVEADVLAGL